LLALAGTEEQTLSGSSALEPNVKRGNPVSLRRDEDAVQYIEQERRVVPTLTATAIAKVKEIMEQQEPKPAALRLACKGGGCSGFAYAMEFENEKGPMDKEFEFDGLRVLVDGISMMYLADCTVDYIETLEASGFKFNNPHTTTCGCGQSFRPEGE
jgi:iron-sulfur cluster assembly accessory protein